MRYGCRLKPQEQDAAPMKPMKSRDIQSRLEREGWIWISKRGTGSHRVFVHPTKAGTIVVTWHKNGSAPVSPGVMRDVVKIAGW